MVRVTRFVKITDRSERQWYFGYQQGGREARAARKEHGWAGGKGDAKRYLRIWRQNNAWSVDAYSRGFVDAWLDAVGC